MGFKGAFRLFRIAGIQVWLHYFWFLMAAFEVTRASAYSSIVWNILEYLALFLIVLTHEFGHAFACRSVGGKADKILLWPFGGIAYVDAPQRPGATLWSIAAGPLVNVVLFPILWGFYYVSRAQDWPVNSPDLHLFIKAMLFIDIGLLIFNMLPIYPLDGGQILRSLLWFLVGRARSLLAATVIGIIGVAGLVILGLWSKDMWLLAIAAYAGSQCWNGFKTAQALRKLELLPRHHEFACPACGSSPPKSPIWICNACKTQFDTFATAGLCPNCGNQFESTRCLDCGQSHPINQWAAPTLTPPRIA